MSGRGVVRVEVTRDLTGRRQEGIYYGARALIRKLAGALVIFITLQLLGWSGYQTPPDGAPLMILI